MRKIILLCLCVFLYSKDLSLLKKYYAQERYDKICTDENTKDLITWNNEGYINIYANSCLKLDKISRLALPITMLIKTKESRANASYYATIFLQKKLLYQAIIDKQDISYINLPKTDYILSKIFHMFVNKKYKKVQNHLEFYEDTNLKHTLHITKNAENIYKIVIKTYIYGKISKTRIYW